MKKHLPNAITLLNLGSGTLALYLVLEGNVTWALVMICAAAVFDFLDGTVARLLNAYSPLGKQLDSLADLVSFGLVPAAMIFVVLRSMVLPGNPGNFDMLSTGNKILLFSPAIIPMFAAVRLARFNLQQSDYEFFGLPVPAFALFWTGVYFDITDDAMLLGKESSVLFLLGLMAMTAFFMVLSLEMISLKFKNLSIRDNIYRYMLVLLSIVVLVFMGISGLSIVIIVYILLSLVRIVLS